MKHTPSQPAAAAFASFLAVAALLTSGCQSSPQIQSLDGIVSTREKIDSNQQALFSLHSLALEPGVLVRLPSGEGTASAIIEHTDAATSHLRVETYAPSMTADDMKTIRTALEGLTLDVGAQVANRVRQARATADERQANANLEAAAENSQKLEIERLNIRRLQVETQRAAIEQLNALNQPENFDGVQRFLESLRSESPQEAAGSNQRVFQAAQDRRTEASSRVAAASESIASKGSDIADSQKALTEALAKPNVVVIRWNAGQRTSGSTSLFSRASANASSQKELAGYAVLNGIRRVRLVVGEDLRTEGESAAAKALGNLAAADGLMDAGKAAIVTSIIQTKELMYFAAEDLEKSVRAQLEVKLKDLTGSGLTAEEIEELKLQAELDLLRISSVQNSGYFSSPRVDMIPIGDWAVLRNGTDKPLRPVRSASGDTNVNDEKQHDWITVHAVTTSVRELLNQRWVESKAP